MHKFQRVFGTTSLIIAVILVLLFISVFFYRDNTLQGLPFLFPVFIAPIGMGLGYLGYSRNRTNKSALYGTIFNLFMFLLPFAYNILGTLLFGP